MVRITRYVRCFLISVKLFFQKIKNKSIALKASFLKNHVYYIHGSTTAVLQLVSTLKFVGFVAMKLDVRKMVSCLWHVMNAGSQFVGLVMITRGVMGTRTVLNATPAISVIRVLR